MVVVADTSPINYLVLIDQIEILRKRQFSGDRGTVRRAASLYGLELLRRHASRAAP